jgi:hypothetical protein
VGLVLVGARAVEDILEFEDVIFGSPPADRIHEHEHVGVETLLSRRLDDGFVRPRPLRTEPYDLGWPAAPIQEGQDVLDAISKCFNPGLVEIHFVLKKPLELINVLHPRLQ